MYKTILVPVDLGHPEAGKKTAAIARKLGGAGARIVLLHVVADVPSFVTAELPSGLMQKNAERARATLKDIASDIGAEAEVRNGHPSTEIIDSAKRLGADLIVIASHRPGLQDYFLGSTASRVVRHATCAVLVDR